MMLLQQPFQKIKEKKFKFCQALDVLEHRNPVSSSEIVFQCEQIPTD